MHLKIKKLNFWVPLHRLPTKILYMILIFQFFKKEGLIHFFKLLASQILNPFLRMALPTASGIGDIAGLNSDLSASCC